MSSEHFILRRITAVEDVIPKCFASMPFANDFNDVFRYGIQKAMNKHRIVCNRVDRDAFTGDICQRIFSMIDDAQLVIADLTGANPNVHHEVGYAQHAEKPIILICRKGDELRFNLRGMRCLFYEDIYDLERQLDIELTGLFAHPSSVGSIP